MGVVKSAWNCINIHSNCIFMQFEWWGMGVRISWRNIWNCIPIVVILHLEICDFSFLKSVTLNFKSCHFALLPPLVFLEAKAPTFFFFILNELHSAAENFTFLTKTNYIPYENALHSLLECTWFSAGMLLVIVRNVKFSRLETIIFLAWKFCILGREMLQSASETISKQYPRWFSLYWTTSS